MADIVAAADEIDQSLAGRSFEDFLADGNARAATLYRLIVIGEAASSLPAALRARHPNVPWRAATAFRNRALHGYFAMDWVIVWDTATVAVPLLRDQIAEILDRDYPTVEIPRGNSEESS